MTMMRLAILGRGGASAGGRRSLATSVTYTRRGEQPATAPTATATVAQDAATGITLASYDDKLPVSSVAVVIKAGSRHDGPAPGLAHVLKSSLVRTIPGDTIVRTIRETELRGNTLYTQHSREAIMIGSDFLRDDLVDAVPLLLNNVFNPAFQAYEFIHAREAAVAETDAELESPQTQVFEALHKTAFRSGLGNPLFASHQAASQLNRAKLLDFVKNNFTSDRVAIVGTGVAAEDLKAVVQESLSKLVGTLPSSTTASTPTTTTSKTKYFGGESRIDAGPNTESHYVVAYPAPASTSADAATATVLRSLLDGTPHVKWGSSSASLLAGSPVPISTFNTAYSDAGLFGFYLQSDSATADEMTASINKAVAALKSVSSSVSETHLARAKKAAIVDYESALDGGRNQRLVILGTQVLSSGCFSKPADFATAVGKVTAADVAKLAKSISAAKPSIVALGDSSVLPYADELKL